METTARANAASEMGEQYSLARILGIWALAAVPIGILSWIIFPAVHLISIRIRWERGSPDSCCSWSV
jgi:hypothetical protein